MTFLGLVSIISSRTGLQRVVCTYYHLGITKVPLTSWGEVLNKPLAVFLCVSQLPGQYVHLKFRLAELDVQQLNHFGESGGEEWNGILINLNLNNLHLIPSMASMGIDEHFDTPPPNSFFLSCSAVICSVKTVCNSWHLAAWSSWAREVSVRGGRYNWKIYETK